MFGGLWPEFDAGRACRSPRSPTACTPRPGWPARSSSSPRRPAPTADPDVRRPRRSGTSSTRSPARTSGPPSAMLRQRLVDDARKRVRKSWQQRGAAPAELGWIDSALDPDVLTIGFARRVPSYKRLTLMLRDPERLKRLLLHPERPVQLVIAGKSHPADEGGKKLIQEIVRFADDPEVRHRIVFLPNYDIAMAQPLYPGCDVWLNNPLRPYEACGTSGHEGGAERRPEPLDPRRLVGRVVRRRQRLGDPVGRRRRRPRPPRRHRGHRALRPDRERGRAAVLRRRRRRACRCAGSRWSGTR